MVVTRDTTMECFFSKWDLHLSAWYGLKPMPVTTGNLSNPIVAVLCFFVLCDPAGSRLGGIFPNS